MASPVVPALPAAIMQFPISGVRCDPGVSVHSGPRLRVLPDVFDTCRPFCWRSHARVPTRHTTPLSLHLLLTLLQNSHLRR